MNGTKWKRNRVNFKLISAVLLSNLLLFFVMSTPEKSSTPIKEGHTLITLSLESYAPAGGEVSLYTPNKKKVIPKALLFAQTSPGDPTEGRLPTFQIQVPRSELGKLIDLKSKYLIAYPANQHKKEQSNEIIF